MPSLVPIILGSFETHAFHLRCTNCVSGLNNCINYSLNQVPHWGPFDNLFQMQLFLEDLVVLSYFRPFLLGSKVALGVAQ